LLRDHPDEAARMGRNARALAEREFDRDLVAERALEVLEEAATRS
jgi:glycosyltransferase involved in cell wall biosynthesis